MAVFDNLNYSYSSGIAPSVQAFHWRTIERAIQKNLPHLRDMQQRTLPANNGRTVTFRRMVPFEPTTTPLQEGVTPVGMTLAMTSFTATIRPYGKHIELTDEVDWVTLDNMTRESAKLLADNATESLDLIARNALHSGLNVMFAGGNTNRASLDATDLLTPALIKKAVTAMKKRYAKRFPDGYYHGFMDPDSYADISDDDLWLDKAKYQDKRKIEDFELGTIYGVKFYETPEAKTFEAETYLYGDVESLTVTGWDANTRKLTVSETLTDFDCRNLIGQLVDIETTVTVGGAAVSKVSVAIEFASTDGEITLRWDPGATITADWTDADNTCGIVPTGAGAAGMVVHSTLIYGQNFAGCVSLNGRGKNVQIIFQPPTDPLHQKKTVGWKVKGFCVVILQDAFGIRIEHGVSAA